MTPPADSQHEAVAYQPLVLLVAALALGMVVDRFAHAPPAAALAYWTVAGCALAFWWLLRKRGQQAAVFLLTAVAATGAVWHHLAWHLYAAHDVALFARDTAQPAFIEGVALHAPEVVPPPPASPYRAIPRSLESRVDVRITAIRDGTAWQKASGRCRLRVVGKLPGIRAGDTVRVVGQLRRPRRPQNAGSFDFAAAARAQWRMADLFCDANTCVAKFANGTGWRPRRQLDAVRDRCLRLLETNIGGNRAPLASAILLGRREGIPRTAMTKYMVTGTMHLLVVSGLHVGLFAAWMFAAKYLGVFPRRAALVGVIVLVVTYCLVAGGKPPVVRATVLVVLFCLASWSGKRAVALNSLAAAALVVLALNPTELFRTGTQLSFLCVATLIWFGRISMKWQMRSATDPLYRLINEARPWYERTLRRVLAWYGWLLVATALVWLTTLPLVASQFHVASPIAVVISPAVWPLVAVALAAGFGTILFGEIAEPLAAACGWTADASLAGLQRLVDWAQGVPGGHQWLAGPACWWTIVFYGGLFCAFATGTRSLRGRWPVGLLSVWVLVGLAAAEWRPRGEALECGFLAVGHGSCAVLRTPAGRTLLYDAGSLSSPELATETVARYLWHHGIHHIDGLVLSHADVDHYNGVPGLVERFSIGTVFVSPVMFDGFDSSAGEASGPARLQRLLTDRQIPLREVFQGDRLRIDDDLAIEIRNPPRAGMLDGDNSNSIVLAVEFAGRRLLLPGDLAGRGLDAVLAELPYDCDILLAPHHGSRRSNPPGFAAWCSPEWVVISGAQGSAQSLAAATYCAAGAVVFETAQTGGVDFRIGKSGEMTAATWIQRVRSAD